ncbi:hypothetical protein HYH03_016851 [Edaphochlamys debaryana]|uniref:Uncharacterized protein n=1 Tax=Edaphochlamys debaryana TaxID=47281 RepID=A0A835XHQ3_9CHLO|nr:hypothetical protein HYH03_016851 [Edaphochlamys debaryana]|eukprot:KAG2484308.1 hypothetical protein HYH03_016851 [Edaphochlamys debaryana]
MRRAAQLAIRRGAWSRSAAVPEASCSGTADTLCAAAAAAGPGSTGLAASCAALPAAAPQTPLHTRGFAAGGAAAGGSGKGRRGSGEATAEAVAADEAARRVMADPMSRLMASQGMPVGMSLQGGAGAQGAAGAGDEDAPRPPKTEPAYDMEAFSDMLRATAAASRRRQGADGAGAASSSGSGGGGSGGAEEGGGFTAGVQHVGPSLEDAWGTTRESPADIARRIVESNRQTGIGAPLGRTLDAALAEAEAEAAARGDDGSGPEDAVGDSDGDEDGDGRPRLSPSEEKYDTLEAMSKDIKRLDEVFEILASVPWLDEDVLAEKELKGVARFGLLGTLEEVGFNIRPQLERIWAGERGAELAAGPGLEFRDQAALLAVLYHTAQLEDQHGPPPGGYLPAPAGAPAGAGQTKAGGQGEK